MSKFIFLLFAYMTLAGCSIGSLANKKTPYIYKNPYHYGVLNKNILMEHEGYTWFLNRYDTVSYTHLTLPTILLV